MQNISKVADKQAERPCVGAKTPVPFKIDKNEFCIRGFDWRRAGELYQREKEWEPVQIRFVDKREKLLDLG